MPIKQVKDISLPSALPYPFPIREHPIYWCLTYVAHLSHQQITRSTGVSPQTLRRMSVGHNVSDQIILTLHALLRKINDHHARPSPRLTPEQTAFRTSIQTIINYTIAATFITDNKRKRVSDLEYHLRAQVHPQGTDRRLILATLHAEGHTRANVLRCADRIGIIRTFDQTTAKEFWYPPPQSLATHITPLSSRPSIKPPTTKRGIDLHNALASLLARNTTTTDPWLSVNRIYKHLATKGFTSRPPIRQAFKDMALQRHIEGFGTKRTTYYGLADPTTLNLEDSV